MPRLKVLITVTTYPLPSKSYDDLVCTAGILENGTWIRIYPIPFSILIDKRFRKYQWIEINLKRRKGHDFRPESYSPVNPDLSDMVILKKIDTKKNWFLRKEYCLKNVYTSMNKLIEDSKSPNFKSLAVFKPNKVTKFTIEKDKENWNPKWIEQRKQLDLFIHSQEDENLAKEIIEKIPFKFKYEFLDKEGTKRKMMIEDWEIGALYRNCLNSSNGNEEEALNKVKAKYEIDFIKNKDLHFFLGTTLQFHRRKARNPFVIIGVFYPKKETQLSLF